MTTVNLTCAYPSHAANSAQPGWNDGVLGTSDTPQSIWCPGCARVAAANPPANLANTTTIQANIQTHLNQMETWLAANPNGAVLTAAQTAFLARMVVGLGRLVLNLTATMGQAS